MSELFVPAPATLGERVLRHGFELAVSLVFALVGLSWFLDPATASVRSPIGRELGPFTWAWSLLYLLAAPMVVGGILRRLNNVRVAGLILLGVGLTMQGAAAMAGSPSLEPRSFAYWIYALVSLARAAYLFRVGERRGQ